MDNHPSNETDTTSDDEITFINSVDNVSFLFKLCDKINFKRNMPLRSQDNLHMF